MKKALSLILALTMVLALCACGQSAATKTTASEGKVFNIYAWNEEFKGFFEKYYTVPEGVTVNWIITPSADGAYQDKLDEALLNQENASADDKVDLFLAEADYIQKYTESPVTQDITALLAPLADKAAAAGKEFINIFYGADICDSDAEQALALFQQHAPDAEVNLVSGGQPIYYYLISAE